jgi:hypothetical protein
MAPVSTLQRLFANGRAPVIWGVVWGVIQAAAPLGFWWLDAATVYAMSVALIASVYIGFAVADGRPTVIAVETTVAAAFVVLAAVAKWLRKAMFAILDPVFAVLLLAAVGGAFERISETAAASAMP